jgi:hypothetical protein
MKLFTFDYNRRNLPEGARADRIQDLVLAALTIELQQIDMVETVFRKDIIERHTFHDHRPRASVRMQAASTRNGYIVGHIQDSRPSSTTHC